MLKKLKTLFLLSFLVLISFYSCEKKEPSKKAEIVSKLQASGKLSSVEFIVTKVISAEKKHFFGDKYFFAETKAFIKAGIDLTKIDDQTVIIDGNKITLLLPAVEITEFNYPPTAFKVIDKYTSKKGFLNIATISLSEIDALYRSGETDIRNSIENLGIKKSAEKNTRMFFENILRSSGFEEIYIDFKSNDLVVEEKSSENKE